MPSQLFPRRWSSDLGFRNPCLVLIVSLGVLGCGPQEEEPVGVAAAPGSDDLVLATDLSNVLLQAPADATAAPRVFFLDYADGSPLPKTDPDPCNKTAPKFVCSFAPTMKECKQQVQAYLDKWYANFNIVFTLTRPTSGWFYTEVVSSGGGAWCDASSRVAGIAPFLCSDLQGGVAYTFSGGKSAKETAIIIAQEQAHLVGLEHTLSSKDIMDPTVCPDCDGFEDTDNQIQTDHCGRAKQNSYQMMEDRLGIWAGGIKPTPFGCSDDRFAPSVQIVTPANNATVQGSFQLTAVASDDCKVSTVSVRVMPMGLQAQSTSPPFDWTLTRITGRQTVTVTAVDPSGKTSSASITVNAPASGSMSSGTGGAGGAGGTKPPGQTDMAAAAAGCNVGGCDVVGAGPTGALGSLWVSVLASLAAVAVVLAATRRRSPVRSRR
jgi:hypothetical protein